MIDKRDAIIHLNRLSSHMNWCKESCPDCSYTSLCNEVVEKAIELESLKSSEETSKLKRTLDALPTLAEAVETKHQAYEVEASFGSLAYQ
jgi:hypothetical protein